MSYEHHSLLRTPPYPDCYYGSVQMADSAQVGELLMEDELGVLVVQLDVLVVEEESPL